MSNLTLLPILSILLQPNNGTAFHLTNIINSVNTNDITIFKLDIDNQKVCDILDDTIKYIRKDIAVAVLNSCLYHQKWLNERSSTVINIILFDDFWQVYGLENYIYYQIIFAV